jgi:AraC-like DNA-binding protein
MTRGDASKTETLNASLMGLQVLNVGRGVKVPGSANIMARRTLNSFAVVYLDAGSGSFVSAATELRPVKQGHLFFLFPGVWHQYGAGEGEVWKEYWFLFDGFIPDRYRQIALLDPARPVYDMGYDRDLIRRWQECLHISETKPPKHALMLSSKLFSMLGHVLDKGHAEDGQADRHSKLISTVVALMEEHVSDASFSLESYAQQLGMCYSGLRRLFKSRVGHSPARYFSRMRIHAAMARLLRTDERIKQIASDLGFEDPYHFSRRFRQIAGLSPEDYRKAFKGQPR